MNKEKVISILEEAGLWEHGQDNGNFVRFPCPWRRWNHPNSKGVGGNNFWLDTVSLNGGCFVCDHHSSLWEILMFRGIFDQRPHLLNLSYEVLLSMEEKETNGIGSAFSEGELKVGKFGIAPDEKILLVKRMKDFFFSLKPNPAEAITYYGVQRKFPFKFPEEVVKRYSLRFDPDEERVLQPLFNLYKGEFSGLTGRSVVPDVPNKAKVYFGTEKTHTFGIRSPDAFWKAPRFIIVEGASSMYKVDYWLNHLDVTGEVLCINGWKLSDEQIRLLSLRFVPILMLLDNDKRGKEGTDYALAKLKSLSPCVREGNLPTGVGDPDELENESQMKEILTKGGWYG